MHRNGGTPGGEARRRHLPALLDLLFPGLGHLFAGRRRRAALFGLPVIGAIVIGALIVASTSIPRLAATLFNPAVLWALLALQPLFLVWRLLAVAASLWDPSLPRPGRVEAIPIVAILALAVVAPQAYAGYATEVARETADEIFAEPSSTARWPDRSQAPNRIRASSSRHRLRRARRRVRRRRRRPPFPASTSCSSASTRASVATRTSPTR